MHELLSPIEQELHFLDWCKRNNVRQFLFDGDDTLWDTVSVFRKHLATSHRYLASVTPLPAEEWKVRMSAINDRLFETHGVTIQRWDYVVAELSEQDHLSEEVKGNTLAIIKQIYEEPPEFLEGTEEALQFLNKVRIPFGIVTHANKEWTRNKYHWLSLPKLLAWEDVYIIDENGHKTKESWREAIKYFGCQPDEIAVVGDSPLSDINPAQTLGVRQLFIIEGDIPRWKVHNVPTDPNVHAIRNLTELIAWGINH